MEFSLRERLQIDQRNLVGISLVQAVDSSRAIKCPAAREGVIQAQKTEIVRNRNLQSPDKADRIQAVRVTC